MVQTEQQYICIHQCLMAVLEGNENISNMQRGELHDNQGYEGMFAALPTHITHPANASACVVTNWCLGFWFANCINTKRATYTFDVRCCHTQNKRLRSIWLL